MNSSLRIAIETFIAQENLPEQYLQTVEQWFIPMAESVLQKLSVSNEPIVVGISGCQGSGKSTLASLLVILLKEMMGLSSINLSIDDFYLTFAERQTLGKKKHPLFSTRGVPGTHDVELAINTIAALKDGGLVSIPRFEKAVDDRAPKAKWPVVKAPVDIIILEGWCLNIGEQPEQDLVEPVNELERQEDAKGVWRRAVNTAIKNDYQKLYELVDFLIMLKAPSFEKVFEWRQRQEDKLIAQQTKQNQKSGSRVMTPTELKRFIQHYERVTRHGLKTLAGKSDIVFELSNDQGILKKA